MEEEKRKNNDPFNGESIAGYEPGRNNRWKLSVNDDIIPPWVFSSYSLEHNIKVGAKSSLHCSMWVPIEKVIQPSDLDGVKSLKLEWFSPDSTVIATFDYEVISYNYSVGGAYDDSGKQKIFVEFELKIENN